MKASELKAGVWYKFFPYDDHRDWYFRPKTDGEYYIAIEYIECDNGSGKRALIRGGTFADYSNLKGGYQEAIPEEINPLLSEDKKLPTSPNYSIY